MKKLQIERHQNGAASPIWITRIPSARLWITQADHLARVTLSSGKRVEILVPINFKFDLASVPRWAWSIIAPFELSLAAPLVHDFLYEQVGHYHEDREPLTRKESDEIFLILMREESVTRWRRNIAHKAVRIGGGSTWRRYQRGEGLRN